VNGTKSEVVRRRVLSYKWGPHSKKFEKRRSRHLNSRTNDCRQFKRLLFSVWGFTFSNIAYIFMIMNDSCLLNSIFVMVNILACSDTVLLGCHNLLYYSYPSEHVVQRLNVCTGSRN
jgi:hypothetical protein